MSSASLKVLVASFSEVSSFQRSQGPVLDYPPFTPSSRAGPGLYNEPKIAEIDADLTEF